MTALSTVDTQTPRFEDPADDLQALSGRLREELEQGYQWFRRWQDERRGETVTPEQHRRAVENAPSTALSWQDYSMVAEADPEAGVLLWERIRAEAARELRSGHLAAKGCETELDRPKHRAQFLEIRRALIESWQPQNGMECLLLDQMAQAHFQQLYWTEEFSRRSRESAASMEKAIEYCRQSEVRGFHWGSWSPPLQREADAIEQAFQMADKWNRIFLRVLRQLRDLRRLCPPVIINNGGQVNVGQQQVNTAQAVSPAKPAALKRRKRRRAPASAASPRPSGSEPRC
jgi:hypothetical protein